MKNGRLIVACATLMLLGGCKKETAAPASTTPAYTTIDWSTGAPSRGLFITQRHRPNPSRSTPTRTRPAGSVRPSTASSMW